MHILGEGEINFTKKFYTVFCLCLYRQQVFDEWKDMKAAKNLSKYDRDRLMAEVYDQTELAKEADAR